MNFTEKTMMLSARDSEDDAMGFYIGMVETSHRLGMPWLRMDQNFQPNHPGKNTNWPGALTIGASFDRQMARLWGAGPLLSPPQRQRTGRHSHRARWLKKRIGRFGRLEII